MAPNKIHVIQVREARYNQEEKNSQLDENTHNDSNGTGKNSNLTNSIWFF